MSTQTWQPFPRWKHPTCDLTAEALLECGTVCPLLEALEHRYTRVLSTPFHRCQTQVQPLAGLSPTLASGSATNSNSAQSTWWSHHGPSYSPALALSLQVQCATIITPHPGAAPNLLLQEGLSQAFMQCPHHAAGYRSALILATVSTFLFQDR